MKIGPIKGVGNPNAPSTFIGAGNFIPSGVAGKAVTPDWNNLTADARLHTIVGETSIDAQKDKNASGDWLTNLINAILRAFSAK